ncbi:hypothetical protein [Komagataeibacter xylinus]|uniref:hypothetical protein n=1 Tax=Acetobacteraceae TaxID=433 RepID=UPI00102F7D8D|nr:hypothetical protein [Komagataeibacter xylinus]
MSDLYQFEKSAIMAVHDARHDIDQLARLLILAGRSMTTRDEPHPDIALQGFGMAVEWAAQEIERRCAAIAERV